MRKCEGCAGKGWQVFKICTGCAGTGLVALKVFCPDQNNMGDVLTIDDLRNGDFFQLSWYRGDNCPKQWHGHYANLVDKKIRNITCQLIDKSGDPVFFKMTPAGVNMVYRFEDPQVALEHAITNAAGHYLEIDHATRQAGFAIIKASDEARRVLNNLLLANRLDAAQHLLIIKLIEQTTNTLKKYEDQTTRFLLGDKDALKPASWQEITK
jgi:hypothetical protein